jgi:adenylyltransferase/sulfurtransferase
MIGTLLLYDALDIRFDQVRLKKNPHCKVCSSEAVITELIDYEAFCGVPGHDHEEGRLQADMEISASELAEQLKNSEPVRLIDVREPHELHISAIPQAELIPLGSLASRMHELDSAEAFVLMCKSGTRSARALELLAGAGFRKLKNLRGGINAWATEVDQSLPTY